MTTQIRRFGVEPDRLTGLGLQNLEVGKSFSRRCWDDSLEKRSILKPSVSHPNELTPYDFPFQIRFISVSTKSYIDSFADNFIDGSAKHKYPWILERLFQLLSWQAYIDSSDIA